MPRLNMTHANTQFNVSTKKIHGTWTEQPYQAAFTVYLATTIARVTIYPSTMAGCASSFVLRT